MTEKLNFRFSIICIIIKIKKKNKYHNTLFAYNMWSVITSKDFFLYITINNQIVIFFLNVVQLCF